MMDLPGLRSKLKDRLAGRALLGAASLAYGAAVRTRRLLYDWRVLKSQRLGARVICFGNLTTGGTGKTPAVALAARALRHRKLGVAILSRGYGRARDKKGITVLRDGHVPAWTECGDEPWMLHQALKGLDVPILVCPDRVAAGREAMSFYQPDVILLDDGFQHLALQRDVDVLMVNARNPFGDRRLLPLGDLREPLGALAKAAMVVLTHADLVGHAELQALKDDIHEVKPGLPIVEAAHALDFLLDAARDERVAVASLKGRQAVSFCGLADPAQFEDQLAAAGVELTQRWRFPDHHAFSLSDLRSIENVRGGLPAVTTLKDLVRLPAGWRDLLGPGVLALGIKLEITKGKTTWGSVLYGEVG
ncbi:MAG: tetraacyldisaccharide 4'-kinase [Elusimicrobia bacterium]|nr:tetraacyldisaccharide 4'-kinase [Elusimicrobiota bacterium]